MRHGKYLFILFWLFTITVTGQKSMDDIDRESFNAGPSPFGREAIIVNLKNKSIKHASSPLHIALNGKWLLAEGGDEKKRTEEIWTDAIEATVPGSVHTALWKSEIIPNPYFGQNDSIAEKQSYKTWWYKKEFTISDKLDKPILYFGGIANKCTIWLNGVQLGEHEGMFGDISLDVSEFFKEKNILIVRLDPIPQIFEFSRKRNISWHNTVVFNCVYGWHYSQIPSLGIWKDVKVINQEKVVIENPFIMTRNIKGDISLHLTLKGISDTKLEGKLKVSIIPETFKGKEQSFEYKVPINMESEILNFNFNISDPQLWWPNGKGEQNLYKAKISFESLSPNIKSSDYKEFTFGIRTVEMTPFPDGPSPDRYNWTFVINDMPMFIKGTGWCAMDPLMDFSHKRYDRFLSVAKLQNIQMLRAWGGGIPETDEFYDLCNRYGIMVLQEWPTAWNSHNSQPYDMLEETIRRNTLRMRNHPSLVMYGGGNESSDPFGKAIDMMGRYSIELDGTRPFHRGEPYGGSDHNYDCWWGEVHLNHNLNMVSPFWGEFGIASFPPKESVHRYIGKDEENIWPPQNGSNLLHHMPVFGQVGEIDKLRQYSGYHMPEDNMDYLITGSQLAQVVAVRHTLERARTRWPESTGALYYKMNDNYPAVSWSCMDWYGAIKPLHYFVQNSFKSLASVILFNQTNLTGFDVDLPVYLLDDNLELEGKNWEVKVTCYNADLNTIGTQSFFGENNQKDVNRLGSFNLSKDKTKSRILLFVSEVISDEEVKFRTFYFMNFEVRRGSLFNLPRTTLETVRNGNNIRITNTGMHPAVGVNIKCPGHESDLTVSEGFFWLNPGESKKLEVNLQQPMITDCWNLEGNPSVK